MKAGREMVLTVQLELDLSPPRVSILGNISHEALARTPTSEFPSFLAWMVMVFHDARRQLLQCADVVVIVVERTGTVATCPVETLNLLEDC